jgi:hypothetical protein
MRSLSGKLGQRSTPFPRSELGSGQITSSASGQITGAITSSDGSPRLALCHYATSRAWLDMKQISATRPFVGEAGRSQTRILPFVIGEDVHARPVAFECWITEIRSGRACRTLGDLRNFNAYPKRLYDRAGNERSASSAGRHRAICPRPRARKACAERQ